MEWRAGALASSVDLLGLGELKWVVLRATCFQVGKDQPLKTLCNDGSKSNRVEVIAAACFVTGIMVVVLKQKEKKAWAFFDENVSKDISQLFCAGMSTQTEWPFKWIHLAQGGAHH